MNKACLLLCLSALALARPLLAQDVIQTQINVITGQMDQLKVDIEKQRLLSLQYKAKKDLRSAATADAALKQKQNLLAVRQAQLTMYQQQQTLAKQPRSDNPLIAGIQATIQQLTIDKSKLAISQLQATQAGNTPLATSYQQQVQAKQAMIQAKQQEIKLLELQAKTGKR